MSERRIPADEIKAFYNKTEQIWALDDWHSRTKKRLDHELRYALPLARSADRVLHLGSAGFDYGIVGTFTAHVDLAERRLAGVQSAVVADVHRLPIGGSAIDLCLCIGTVLNYCDAAVAILEMCRVIRPGGWLVLEFETSDSWEFFGSRAFRRAAALVETFYGERTKISLWAYSVKYISGLLEAQGVMVSRISRIHILSSLAYKLFGRSEMAAKFASADVIVQVIPGLSKGASSVILFCQKDP